MTNKLRRKPLPYASVELIDKALMANADAVRALLPLVRGTILDPAEKMGKLGEVIHQIHESTSYLKEAKAIQPEESEQ